MLFLRDVVIPFVREREKEGKVDFSAFECGTAKCLLGWCWEFPELGLTKGSSPDHEMLALTGKVTGEYGVWWSDLFGNSAYGTLDDRAKVVDRLIEAKIAEAVET